MVAYNRLIWVELELSAPDSLLILANSFDKRLHYRHEGYDDELTVFTSCVEPWDCVWWWSARLRSTIAMKNSLSGTRYLSQEERLIERVGAFYLRNLCKIDQWITILRFIAATIRVSTHNDFAEIQRCVPNVWMKWSKILLLSIDRPTTMNVVIEFPTETQSFSFFFVEKKQKSRPNKC